MRRGSVYARLTETEVHRPAHTALRAGYRGDPQPHAVDHLGRMGVQPEGTAAQRAGLRHRSPVDENRRIDQQWTLGPAAGLEPSEAFLIAHQARMRPRAQAALRAPRSSSRHSATMRRPVPRDKCRARCTGLRAKDTAATL